MKIKQWGLRGCQRATVSRQVMLANTLVLVFLCVQVAYANHGHKKGNLYDNCTLAGSNPVSTHVEGTFESTSPHLHFLSKWFDLDHIPGWTCMTYRDDMTSGLVVGVKTWISNPYWESSFEHDGATYTIYKAGPAAHHVGYIMRQNPSITQSVEQPHDVWRALNIHNANNDDLHKFLLINAHETNYTVSIRTQARLIKWDPDGTFAEANFSIPEFKAAEFAYWTERLGTKQYHHWPKPQEFADRPRRSSMISATLKRIDNTCMTPSSQLVKLPDVPVSDFAKQATSGNTPFKLELTNCSPNIKSIQYTFQGNSGNTPEDNQDGRLALSPGSSATGVQVQVREQSGQVIKFSNQVKYAVPNHIQGNATASIPLQARYIKSGTHVGAGRVYASMTVTYVYH